LETEVAMVGLDIFFASSFTISENLMWTLHVLATETGVQQELRSKLDDTGDG
jgi:hypothetical protein